MNGCSQFVVSPLIFVLMNRTKQTSKPTSKQSAHKKASIDETFAQLLPNLLPVTVDAVPAKVAPDDALLNLPEARPTPATLPHGEKTAASGPDTTFFKPVRCGCERSAIYVSLSTRRRVMAVLHLLGGDGARLTALVDNMLCFVLDLYGDELNDLHEKKNCRRMF